MQRWLVFGDSHVGPFRWAADHGLIARPCTFLEVGGATSVGLRNPNSATNALDLFASELLPPRPHTVPVMHLGEVDCGFVIWWRSAKYGEPIEAQLAASIEAYMAFVDRYLIRPYGTAVITGATLPTILDGQDWGDVANKRREVSASLGDRTRLTLEYNRRLAAGAGDRGLPFIDLTPLVLDETTGVISDHFRNPDPRDHHLHPERAGSAWAGLLNGLGTLTR